MQNATKTKTIPLTNEQLNLLFTMIRSAELRTRKQPEGHFPLLEKIRNAKLGMRKGMYSAVILDQDECKLIRQYNTSYCDILADNDDEGGLHESQVIHIYQQATHIQMLITPRY